MNSHNGSDSFLINSGVNNVTGNGIILNKLIEMDKNNQIKHSY